MDDAACLLLLGVSAMSLVAAAQRGKSLLWLLATPYYKAWPSN
jgi:hypothetical protein